MDDEYLFLHILLTIFLIINASIVKNLIHCRSYLVRNTNLKCSPESFLSLCNHNRCPLGLQITQRWFERMQTLYRTNLFLFNLFSFNSESLYMLLTVSIHSLLLNYFIKAIMTNAITVTKNNSGACRSKCENQVVNIHVTLLSQPLTLGDGFVFVI